jgi:hypothetical protein
VPTAHEHHAVQFEETAACLVALPCATTRGSASSLTRAAAARKLRKRRLRAS